MITVAYAWRKFGKNMWWTIVTERNTGNGTRQARRGTAARVNSSGSADEAQHNTSQSVEEEESVLFSRCCYCCCYWLWRQVAPMAPVRRPRIFSFHPSWRTRRVAWVWIYSSVRYAIIAVGFFTAVSASKTAILYTQTPSTRNGTFGAFCH